MKLAAGRVQLRDEGTDLRRDFYQTVLQTAARQHGYHASTPDNDSTGVFTYKRRYRLARLLGRQRPYSPSENCVRNHSAPNRMSNSDCDTLFRAVSEFLRLAR